MVRTKDNIAKLTLEFTAITDQTDIPGEGPFLILIHEHIIHGYKIILDSSDHEFLIRQRTCLKRNIVGMVITGNNPIHLACHKINLRCHI